jgi:predicted Rossmann-fold nucleotide-binding protein
MNLRGFTALYFFEVFFMSLNESTDCRVQEIVRSDSKEVVAVVSVCLESEQLEYFVRNRDCLSTDLHSTKARLGINQQKLSDFERDGNCIAYTARFWFYIPEYSAGLTIDQLITPELKVGKIYLRNPELKYSAEELINLISNRTIIVPKGTRVLEEGVLAVPIMPYVHLPNPKILTSEYLRAAMVKKIPREDLYFVQPEQKVEQIVVPAGSGIIAHTSLFTQQNEIYILDEEHADARVGSTHTNGIIYIELVGKEEDFAKDTVHYEVYKPASPIKQSREKHFIDLHSQKIENIYQKGAVDSTKIVSFNETDKQRNFKLNDYYAGLLHELEPNTAIVIQDFPNRRLASFLIVAADMGLLKHLVFRNAPEEHYFFTAEDLAFLNTLQEMGVGICWKNPMQGDLVLYRQFFMRSSVIPSFNEAISSRKLAAIYGSAGNVDVATKKDIVDAVKSFKDFHGGICGILTGGSAGTISSTVSKATASLGMLCGAAYWKIPGVDINPEVDFGAYLGRNDLLARQEILSDTTEADIYIKGGVGTNLEIAITFVKRKLGIGHYKPQIFVGDFYTSLQSLLEHLTSESMVDPKVFKNCYFVKHGGEVFGTLCKHFSSESKMIYEVSPE